MIPGPKAQEAQPSSPPFQGTPARCFKSLICIVLSGKKPAPETGESYRRGALDISHPFPSAAIIHGTLERVDCLKPLGSRCPKGENKPWLST